MVIASVGGAIVANVAEGPWAIIGDVAAVAMLTIYISIEIVKPWLDKRKRKNPAQCFFILTNSKRSLSSRDVSRGDAHRVRHLVLPSNQLFECVIGTSTKVPISISEIVIGCDDDSGPKLNNRFDSLRKHGRTATYANDFVDTLGFLHMTVQNTSNVGTVFLCALRGQTQKAGTYDVLVSFITDDVEGRYKGLKFIIEDDPKTRMLCNTER